MTQFGFISTYPPTRCGLATFTVSLARALTALSAAPASIVRLLDDDETAEQVPDDIGRVVAVVRTDDPLSQRVAAARALSDCDVIIMQHEYGVFGGEDGEHAISLLRALPAPSIVVLHTVLATPSAHQRAVLEEVVALAGAAVVMTEHARSILGDVYDVDLAKVSVIPHGVHAGEHAAHHRGDVGRMLTWGLLSPGKGVERGIRALALLHMRGIAAEYVIAGETHPKVRAREGEAYRRQLEGLSRALGVEDSVTFRDQYLTEDEIAGLLDSADVVLLPYESHEQATSGVLVETVAAGVPVVATAFPHALELLTDGVGTAVPHDDPTAMADALQSFLATPGAPDAVSTALARAGTGLTWPQVAERYVALARGIHFRRAA